MKFKWIDDSQGVTLEKFMSIEMVAVKSYKSPVFSGWNDWQNIIIEIECGDTGMDKADENSQYLETYDAMRKTTESEREAKDPITEQINKYARNGGRRYQAKAISWNQAKSVDDAAEKFVSNDDKKILAESTQSLENVLEQSSKLSLNSKPSLRCEGRCIKSKRSFSRSSPRRTGRTTTS